MYYSQFSKLILLALLILGSVQCQPKDEKNTKHTLRITVTTGMIADMVREIAQDRAEVKALMGAGTDPHLYKATPQDLVHLREADVIFYNGLHLEGKLSEVLEKVGKNKPAFAVADGLPTDKVMQEGEAKDPHIWFDVMLWQKATAYVGKKLGEIDAPNASFYQKNAEAYSQKLEALHAEVKAKIGSIPANQRVLVTAHDAFGYFGKAYSVEVRGLQGISTMSEYGLKDISNLTNFLAERKIKAIFVESSVPAKSIEAVVKGCKQKGHQIVIGGTLFSDAMGAENTPEGNYIGMVRANVNTIVNALK
ncbi:MAG: manganese transporter [Bacteroidetes bacterium]|nr:MAG: manganese transporter [Bacteroidota bacterium]